jgi:hypothetical protein
MPEWESYVSNLYELKPLIAETEVREDKAKENLKTAANDKAGLSAIFKESKGALDQKFQGEYLPQGGRPPVVMQVLAAYIEARNQLNELKQNAGSYSKRVFSRLKSYFEDRANKLHSQVQDYATFLAAYAQLHEQDLHENYEKAKRAPSQIKAGMGEFKKLLSDYKRAFTRLELPAVYALK